MVVKVTVETASYTRHLTWAGLLSLTKSSSEGKDGGTSFGGSNGRRLIGFGGVRTGRARHKEPSTCCSCMTYIQ